MTSELEIVKQLENSLRKNLPKYYTLSRALAGVSIDKNHANPDLVINRGDKLRPILIEIKTSSPDFDLPLSTAHFTKSLKEANNYNDPEIFLITTGHIGNLLSRELFQQQVKVFEEPSLVSAETKDFRGVLERLVGKIVNSIQGEAKEQMPSL